MYSLLCQNSSIICGLYAVPVWCMHNSAGSSLEQHFNISVSVHFSLFNFLGGSSNLVGKAKQGNKEWMQPPD